MENDEIIIAIFLSSSLLITGLIVAFLVINDQQKKEAYEQELAFEKILFQKNQEIINGIIEREQSHFTLGSDRKKVRLVSMDVLYVQSDGNYIAVYTKDDRFIIRNRISDFLERVPDPENFIQVHRSYIVRKDKIREVSSNFILVGKTEIRIGKKYYVDLFNELS